MCENICGDCNQVKDINTKVKVPSQYIGETSRTIHKRGKGHWAVYRGGEKIELVSHAHKHKELQHKGEEATPRAISFHRSVLSCPDKLQRQ